MLIKIEINYLKKIENNLKSVVTIYKKYLTFKKLTQHLGGGFKSRHSYPKNKTVVLNRVFVTSYFFKLQKTVYQYTLN